MVFSPSVLLFYLGFNQTIPNLLHHNFFFETDLDTHLEAVFALEPAKHRNGNYARSVLDEALNAAVQNFTFYVSATTKTDPKGAVRGGEALFVLIPTPYTMNDLLSRCSKEEDQQHADIEYDPPVGIGKEKDARERTSSSSNIKPGTCQAQFWKKLLHQVLIRMEQRLQLPSGQLKRTLVYERHAGTREFEQGFNSFRGNAFGLANTLTQSLIFKPSLESKV